MLGCDTLVALGGQIYGKPSDESAARVTLQALGGETHEVVSGLALLAPDGEEHVAVAHTAVAFRAIDQALLDWYLARGEWRGRAGGYAIQGAGAALVRAVDGDYENVVGLPVAVLLEHLSGAVGGPANPLAAMEAGDRRPLDCRWQRRPPGTLRIAGAQPSSSAACAHEPDGRTEPDR